MVFDTIHLEVFYMLKIKNLCVKIEEKEILNQLNLEIKDGEIHVLMGPNGAGKSTVCKRIMHHPNYLNTSGKIYYNEEEITTKRTSDIAKLGIYYISQSPIEIEGITNVEMLRTSMIENDKKMDIFAFNKKCNEICEKLALPKTFLHRHVNVGMSGGERKKNELLHMWFLEPSLLLLDEIDSGLDIDALKIVGNNILEYHQKTKAKILLVTHQMNLIKMLKPDYVHIMKEGTIIKSGDFNLALEIEKNGFAQINEANNVSLGEKSE